MNGACCNLCGSTFESEQIILLSGCPVCSWDGWGDAKDIIAWIKKNEKLMEINNLKGGRDGI